MKQLANQSASFESQSELSESLVAEYYKRNERKKNDEKWLKENREAFVNALTKLGKSKVDFGQYRVSISTPNTSNFDDGLVLKFLESKGLLEKATKRVPDEDKIAELIEQGEIDVEELKEAAWVNSSGTPRLTVSLVGGKKSTTPPYRGWSL